MKRFIAQLACAGLALAFVMLLCAPAFAAQDGTITFSPPTTGGAPSGYRLYRDGVSAGIACTPPLTGLCITSGQTVPALFPADTGTFAVAVEPFNATGAGPRTMASVVINPAAPGAVPKIIITVPCATTSPPTCTVTVN